MKDCVFKCLYRDHGCSVNTCTLLPASGEYRDLAQDVKRYKDCCPCPYFLTIDDLRSNVDTIVDFIVNNIRR